MKIKVDVPRCERCETDTHGLQGGGLICEKHRGAWPHDDCPGPGEPCPNCQRRAEGYDRDHEAMMKLRSLDTFVLIRVNGRFVDRLEAARIHFNDPDLDGSSGTLHTGDFL